MDERYAAGAGRAGAARVRFIHTVMDERYFAREHMDVRREAYQFGTRLRMNGTPRAQERYSPSHPKLTFP